MERRKVRLNYAAGLLFAMSCVLPAGEIDVTKIENRMDELKRTLNSMSDSSVRQNVYYRVKRDPFVPLTSEKPVVENRAEEKPKIIPVVHVTGIVYNTRMPLAIIGTEVKKQGEFVGEFQVNKIEEDRVLIKYGEELFPFEVKK